MSIFLPSLRMIFLPVGFVLGSAYRLSGHLAFQLSTITSSVSLSDYPAIPMIIVKNVARPWVSQERSKVQKKQRKFAEKQYKARLARQVASSPTFPCSDHCNACIVSPVTASTELAEYSANSLQSPPQWFSRPDPWYLRSVASREPFPWKLRSVRRFELVEPCCHVAGCTKSA